MKKGRSKRRKLMPALFMAMISERLANCVVKKNHGNEDKQRREHVREVGDEVRIVVEHHFVPAGSAVGELVDLLVEVKDDGNRDDEGQQKHVGAEKTHEYVAVDALETDDAQEQSADGQQQSHDPAE